MRLLLVAAFIVLAACAPKPVVEPVAVPVSRADHAMLSSWNEGAARSAILRFVQATATEGPDFVPPEARIAAFVPDGTLWPEQAAYPLKPFLIDLLGARAAAHPGWEGKEPFRTGLGGGLAGHPKPSRRR